MTLDEAAAILNVSEATVRRLIAAQILPAHQFCKGAPWVIRSADLEQENVRHAANDRRARRPPSENVLQNTLAF
jgi:excisionase family DNA binding protein